MENPQNPQQPFDQEEIWQVPITRELDLHTFKPKEIPSVVHEYLTCAIEKGFQEVRIIHGKGIGVQRQIVQNILRTSQLVDSFRDGGAFDGGLGATVVQLKIKND